MGESFGVLNKIEWGDRKGLPHRLQILPGWFSLI
jgi:hypothetical protein